MYKRILLKLSGEQLAGDLGHGIDTSRVEWIAGQIKSAQQAGTQIVVMVGGGNFIRGAQVAGHGIGDVTAHNAGMMATLINATIVADIFNAAGVPARALTTVEVNQFADQYTYRRAANHLEKGRVVIVGCGTGRPFLTTDTAAVNLALEMQCDVVIKTTKVDGVYSADPVTHPDAQKIDELSYDDVLKNPDILVMDKAAIGLAMEEGKPVLICSLLTDGNIARAAAGERVGSLVH